jgi:hypothetical protein
MDGSMKDSEQTLLDRAATAAERLRTELLTDEADLSASSQWADGRRLTADAAEAARRVLAELEKGERA